MMLAVTSELRFEAFGVRVAVTAPAGEPFEHIVAALPPHRRPCQEDRADVEITLLPDAEGEFQVIKNGAVVAGALPLTIAADLVERELRLEVAVRAPAATFVHAGVVAQEGRALVLPGPSFSGKSTLVAALVRAGATYFSDEYAVLDDEGLVHPYARPLAIRSDGVVHERHAVTTLGGAAATDPVRVGAVIVTTYRQGATWHPAPLSPGEAVLALLANTIPARSRPSQSIQAIGRAIEGAVLLQGERGEGKTLAPLLLESLGRGDR
jgi:hypothetical protein